jgi:hypothetical protein
MPKSKQRWYVRRIPLNVYGYTPQGEYYGIGRSLWFAHSADGTLDFTMRSVSKLIVYAACNWVRYHCDPEAACRYIQSQGYNPK